MTTFQTIAISSFFGSTKIQSNMMTSVGRTQGPHMVLFSCVRKVFEIESLNISSIKHRLITKLITELVYKPRDESNESN